MLKKYKYKLRILYVRTPSYQDKDYLKTKEKYENNQNINRYVIFSFFIYVCKCR